MLHHTAEQPTACISISISIYLSIYYMYISCVFCSFMPACVDPSPAHSLCFSPPPCSVQDLDRLGPGPRLLEPCSLLARSGSTQRCGSVIVKIVVAVIVATILSTRIALIVFSITAISDIIDIIIIIITITTTATPAADGHRNASSPVMLSFLDGQGMRAMEIDSGHRTSSLSSGRKQERCVGIRVESSRVESS